MVVPGTTTTVVVVQQLAGMKKVGGGGDDWSVACALQERERETWSLLPSLR